MSKKSNLDFQSSWKFKDIQTTGITSRDQILDPYDLVRVGDYGNNRVDRAQYEQDLAQAIRLAEMQEASYQEWYNSEAQQAIRQRAAGLNPDLLGVETGSASDVAAPDSSPMEGLPTNGQILRNTVDSLSNLVGSLSSVAALATSFAQIPLIKSQRNLAEAQSDSAVLANVTQFEQLAHSAISDKLSKYVSAASAAGEVVDIASFFADDNNFSDIIPSYAPSDDARYQNALQRVRTGSQSVLSKAYETSAQSGINQRSFADVLSNPYYSSDVKLQVAMLAPVAKAVEDLRLLGVQYNTDVAKLKSDYVNGLDVDAATTAFNEANLYSSAQSSYYKEYYDDLDGKVQARLEQFKLAAQSVVDSIGAQIQDNLFQMYKVNPVDYTSASALFMLLAGAGMHWQDYIAANMLSLGNIAPSPSDLPLSKSSSPESKPLSDDPDVNYAQKAGYLIFGND